MAKLTIIRFDINRPDGHDVNRLPDGIKGDPGLMMWKELCRSGVYETNGVKHDINREFLQNIVKTFWERNKKGIEVPCPVGHTHDPEAKRGKVVYVELREKKDGAISLYGIIEFVSEEAKEKLCNSGVSIEAPEVVTDGDGETHKFGLEHVAFTDYPVVAGMEGFRDVTFSIFKKKDKKMGKKKRRFSDEERDEELNKCPHCGHTFDDDGEGDEEEKNVSQSRKRCGRSFADEDEDEEDIKESRRCGRKFSDEDEGDVRQSRKRCGRSFADDDEEDEEDYTESRRCSRRCSKKFADVTYEDDDEDEDEEDVKQSRRCSRKFGKRFSLGRDNGSAQLLLQNRTMQIENLLKDGYINRMQAERIQNDYCSRRAISFALDYPGDKNFDNLVALLSMGSYAHFGEETGVQFSNPRKEEDGTSLTRYMDRKYGGDK